jgi:hypothetical protein
MEGLEQASDQEKKAPTNVIANAFEANAGNKPKIELGYGDTDISDVMTAESKHKIWQMAAKNIRTDSPEYKDNTNIAEDMATYTRRIGDNGEAIISVFVKGNYAKKIAQSFELGKFDMNKNIDFNDNLKQALNDKERENINKCFA